LLRFVQPVNISHYVRLLRFAQPINISHYITLLCFVQPVNISHYVRLLRSVQLTDAGDVVARAVLTAYIEACVWNIAQTDIQTVEQAIQTFEITIEVVSIYSVEITTILDRVLAVSCPGQPACSGNGRCVVGRCACDRGYFICFPFCFLLVFYIIIILYTYIGSNRTCV